MMNLDSDVIFATLKLARAMRRCPPERREHPFPPAIGRLLECAAHNPGVSSRELCELLDLRPSSLSEMLTRAEAEGLLTRTVDEADRRVQHITLSDKGKRLITEMETAREQDARKRTACFTEAEKKQFCELCNKLSEHMERLALDLPEDRIMPPPPPGHPDFRPPFPPPMPPKPNDGQLDDSDSPDRPDRPHFPPGTRFKC